ncbi:unnamed protein product [Phaeothamnion confervicola]
MRPGSHRSSDDFGGGNNGGGGGSGTSMAGLDLSRSASSRAAAGAVSGRSVRGGSHGVGRSSSGPIAGSGIRSGPGRTGDSSSGGLEGIGLLAGNNQVALDGLIEALSAGRGPVTLGGTEGGRGSGGGGGLHGNGIAGRAGGNRLFDLAAMLTHGQLLGGDGGLFGEGRGMGMAGTIGDYAFGDITRIIEQISLADAGRFGAPPTARHALEALPLIPVTEADTALECTVCKDNLAMGEQINKLPCNHVFHPGCIRPWLEQVSQPLERVGLGARGGGFCSTSAGHDFVYKNVNSRRSELLSKFRTGKKGLCQGRSLCNHAPIKHSEATMLR